MDKTDLFKEFDRQLENLIGKGYPKIAGLSKEAFRNIVTPLRSKLGAIKLPDLDLYITYL